MDHAWREFKSSLSEVKRGNTVPTMFRYSPIESEANNAVRIGIEELKRSAQFLVTFNKGFSKINFKSDDETVSFSVAEREELLRENGLPKIMEITVSEETNGTLSKHSHILVEDAETSTSIVIPIQIVGDARECLGVEETPRLFLQFPLVGTDKFSFPVIINSGQFTTLPTRDGVPFNDEDVNRKNWQAFGVACELLVSLLKYAASKGWSNAYTLAHIPLISQRDWLDSSSLRDNIREHFIERICDTAVVLGEVGGDSISPKESVLPVARKDDNNVEILWGLLNDMQEKYAGLPKQKEAVGWCQAVKSWKDVHDNSFGVGFDCQELAKEIDGKALELEKEIREKGNTDKEEILANILRLKLGVDPIDWLNRFHDLIDREELRKEVDGCRIVLAQDGQLRKLSELHCDAGVARELKDIAELLEGPIRCKLRDIRIDSLDEKDGAGKWSDKTVINQLIEELRKRSDADPDDHFAKASVGIFKWIAGHKDWNRLIDFPAFAGKDLANGEKHIIKLQRVQEEDGEYPCLAPVRSWMEDLQHYSDLFPKSCVLANAFFEEVPNPDVWQALDAEGFVKNGVIIKRIKKDVEPIPDDSTKYKDKVRHFPTDTENITVTNITFLTKDSIGIMSRVPDSQRLARLFWCFMVDWLLKHGSLENKPAKCADCGNEHRYPLAEWLTPVQENKWVPMGKRGKARANAESLGKLFRGEPEAHSLNSERAADLLLAIGVSDPNTVRFTSATLKDQKTALDLLHKVQDNPDLADIVEKHVKQRETVHKNQLLGELVEELVKEILKDKGFNVHKTGIGSDFEISAEIGGVATLKLTHPEGNQIWLVEVKATSGNEEVKMTLTQAEEARREGDRYLLCVVPLEGSEPEKDTVREKMRFIQNIGDDVAKLVRDFDDFKSRRDNITEGKNQGVQLSISPGTERILVKKSVWEERGFPLDELAQKLKDF